MTPPTTNAHRWVPPVRVAFQLIALVSFILAASVSSDITSLCDLTDEALGQFDVLVSTREPLGLRLSERLEILEFVVDAEGRARAVEASGLAEVGDRLLAVNGGCVAGIQGGLRAAVEVLQRAQRPMTLRFQARDGRRILSDDVGGDSASTVATGSENEAPMPTATPPEAKKETFDYVVRAAAPRIVLWLGT